MAARPSMNSFLISMTLFAIVVSQAAAGEKKAEEVLSVHSGTIHGNDSIPAAAGPGSITGIDNSEAFRFGIEFHGGMRLPDPRKYPSVSSGFAWGIGAHLNFGGSFGIHPQINIWESTLRSTGNSVEDIRVRDISIILYYQPCVHRTVFRPGLGIGLDHVFTFTASLSTMFAPESRISPFIDIRIQRAARWDRKPGSDEDYLTFMVLLGLEMTWSLKHTR